MKRTTFVLLVAAMAAMGLVACEKEKSPGNNPAGGGQVAPWYQSLVDTRWYCHTDIRVHATHHEEDTFWDIIDDSTIVRTTFNTILNGIPMDDTIVVSIKYSYNPDSLVLTEFFRDGETQDYILDTVQKTLTYTFPENMPGNLEPMVFTLVEQ